MAIRRDDDDRAGQPNRQTSTRVLIRPAQALSRTSATRLLSTQAVRAYLQHIEAAEEFGLEQNTMLREYGNLLEGLTFEPRTGAERRALLVRYARRLRLANFSRFPEGYVFSSDAVSHRITLLTPPHLIAVRRSNGTWYRRPRDEAQDGPAPYSPSWYREQYLARHHLPSWMFSEAHLHMLTVTTERRRLGLLGVNLLSPPPDDYLQRLYPERPQWLAVNHAPHDGRYLFELNTEERARIARHFPFVNELALPCLVDVLPSGHLIVPQRSPNTQSITAATGSISWLSSPPSTFASYTTENSVSDSRDLGNLKQQQGQRQTGPSPLASFRARVDLIEESGAIVNPPMPVQGRGVYTWLDISNDAPHAARLGFTSPAEYARAFHDGALNRDSTMPSLVFWPDLNMLNPTVQPAGRGRFEFLTVHGDGSARALAWLNFGGQADFGFDNVPHPTANDIWHLRQQFVREGREDYTRDVDLVWIPDTDTPASDVVESWTARLRNVGRRSLNKSVETLDEHVGAVEEESNEASGDESRIEEDESKLFGHTLGLLDPETHLDHEPTNRGENNQTAPAGRAHYQTRQLPEGQPNARTYTLDRHVANVGLREPWKGWVVDGKGRWAKYQHLDTLDWNDRDAITKLNKWREMTLARYGWPAKRTKRQAYTHEQRQWLFSFVKEAKGDRPKTPLETIVQRFRQRFSDRQAVDRAGLQSALIRLRAEYAMYEGNMKPRTSKPKTIKGKRKREESEEDGDD